MNGNLKSLMLLCPAICFSSNCDAGEDIIEKALDLQKTAQTVNAENLGVGMVTLITSQGEVKAVCNSDTTNVFGKKIKTSDILVLLQARIESYRTRRTGPMSGEVRELCSNCLSALALARDPQSIFVIKSLLDDPDEVIKELAVITLLNLAGNDQKLEEQISQVRFPIGTINRVKKQGHSVPSWLVVKN